MIGRFASVDDILYYSYGLFIFLIWYCNWTWGMSSFFVPTSRVNKGKHCYCSLAFSNNIIIWAIIS